MANMLSYPRCDINDKEGLLWAHVACLSISAALIIASFVSQFRDPAPYGRHYTAEKGKQWGKGINQRLGHFISDALPGVPFFLLVYLLYAGLVPSGGSSRAAFSQVRALSVLLLSITFCAQFRMHSL